MTNSSHAQYLIMSTERNSAGGFQAQCYLVKWCFEPSQPLGIISELKETFIKRHMVERTNKAEIRPEEQKTESRQEN